MGGALEVGQMLILVVLRFLALGTGLLQLPLEAGDVRAEHFGLIVDYLVRVCVHLERVRSIV